MYYQGQRYLFDSKEQDGAAVDLAQIEHVQQVHKRLTLRDLNVRMCFLLQRQRVYKIEMRVYTRVGRRSSSVHSQGNHHSKVFTVVVRMDGTRVRIP